MQDKSKVCIVGPGALGAFYASKFVRYDPDEVFFLAGGQRYDRLVSRGVEVNGTSYKIAVQRPEEKGPTADLVILAVKYDHLPQAVQDMNNVVGENSTILSVMNGIDSEELVAETFGWDKVIYGVLLGIDAVRQENKVTYTQEGTLFFGEASNANLSDRVKALRNLFDKAGIVYEIPEDMLRIMWWKFMINVGINQVSAVIRVPYGAFQRTVEAQELMESAMREVLQIARAEKINIGEEDITNWYSFLSSLSPQGKTSMRQDVEAGRKTEVEMFAGKVAEIGRKHNIATPVNEMLFKMIRAVENNYPESVG